MKTYIFDYDKLRALIRRKIRTESEFARQIGRSNAYVSLALNGHRQFSQSDIYKAVDVLGIDPADIDTYFFTLDVHKSGT